MRPTREQIRQSIVSGRQKTVLTQINEKTISGGCTLIGSIVADEETVYPGSSFTPALTSKPKAISIFKDGVEQNVGKSFAVNGTYYDITIYSVDTIENAEINVII